MGYMYQKKAISTELTENVAPFKTNHKTDTNRLIPLAISV